MRQKRTGLTPGLVKKLWLVFFLVIVLMGASYVLITGFFANRYNQATAQRVNAQVAQHLIEEKFKEASPFLEDGSPNKALFADLMHDMMAVNRSIEVYLLSEAGEILYSVVLDHSDNAPATFVSLDPVNSFIDSNGEDFILGDDPRNPGEKKIFSTAAFEVDGQKGFIYIILAGQEFQAISKNLMEQYFVNLGLGAFLITMLFALLIGLASIWFLTKNLRLITHTVQKFREGDLNVRISEPHRSNVEAFALAFNEMADTIVGNIEKLKSVDTLRKELIANVSHDLRTPLAILKGYVETLQMKGDELKAEDRQEYLQSLNSNIDKLTRLVDQLFEYSKLEAEQITPVKEPFSITELSHDLVAKFKVLAEQKNIELRLDHQAENNLVYADLGLVERALQNLLENAIKYTDPGGKVTLSVLRKEDSIEINIADTGRGIPLNEQPFIFDRYKQIGTEKKKQGYGLGLAIVKKIMELHDTKITVTSRPREGSSFAFSLPAF